MAKQGLSTSIPKQPDTYELKHALGQVKKISVRHQNHRSRNNSNQEPSITNTTANIGEVNVTINNASIPYETSGHIGSHLTEADIDLKITNIELKYTKSQATFQKEIRDAITNHKESIRDSIDEKVSKKSIYWAIGITLPIILSVLGYYFFEIQDLKHNVSNIDYELEGIKTKNNATTIESISILDSTVVLPKQMNSNYTKGGKE